jgi:hypothetical protein
MIFTPHHIIFRRSAQEKCDWCGVWNVGVQAGFWWEDPKDRNHLQYLGLENNNIKMDLQELGW